MFKKLLCVSSLLISTAVTAHPAPYVGAGLGVNVITSTSVATSSGFGQAANFRGVPYNVFLGYGGVVTDTFYLAGELTGTLATSTISNKNGLKTSYGYGVSVLPGVMLSDHTLAFARAGFVRTRFTNAHSMQTGGQLGAGLQTSVTQNVDLRGEYDFTAYHSFDNNHGRISAPRSDAFNLSLIYKFE